MSEFEDKRLEDRELMAIVTVPSTTRPLLSRRR